MRSPRAVAVETGASGSWQILTRSPGQNTVNVTMFRGAPTQLGSLATTDPFGPSTASLTFPAVTILDTIGSGDLTWLVPEMDVDICWADPEGVVLYTWEGYAVSFEFAEEQAGSTLSVTCKGALLQADNHLAKPEYRYSPVPYEVAMLAQLDRRNYPDLRLGIPDSVEASFPSWWTNTFTLANYPTNQPWMRPTGVSEGDKWSGMLTRESGNFEPALTGYVQGLLSNMHTERGQFTLLLRDGRVPYLKHRDHLTQPDPDTTLLVDLLWPGVQMSATRDFTQRTNVVYAQGTSTNGDTYTGMQVTADGSATFYEPYAYRRQVHPASNDNDWLDPSVMRRETKLDVADGLTPKEARKYAEAYLARFSDPGVTGSITLTTDPLYWSSSTPTPRQMVQAGQSIMVRGLFGSQQGVLMHITETSLSAEGQQTLTVDSLFRDQITVEQVRQRGRDSLVPYRSLSISGTYAPKIADLLFPWSYADGSGAMPMESKPMFGRAVHLLRGNGYAGDPDRVEFPWTEFTTLLPPRKHPEFYVAIPPANTLYADSNWANPNYKKGRTRQQNLSAFTTAYPVRLSAAGDLKLFQFAAYDKDGNVKKVPFHVSLWDATGTSYTMMPMIPEGSSEPIAQGVGAAHAVTIALTAGSTQVRLSWLPSGHGFRVGSSVKVQSVMASRSDGDPDSSVDNIFVVESWGDRTLTFNLDDASTVTREGTAAVFRVFSAPGTAYGPGQHYPFFPEAWEKIRADGTKPQEALTTAADKLLAGWGTFYEKAGYWPGSSATGTAPTGLLSDESSVAWDFRSQDNRINQYVPYEQQVASSVNAYLMVYCDADPNDWTYFLGRAYRKESMG